MKHCEAIAIELTPAGAIFQDAAWPEEIEVDRSLLEYPQGPHVQFGRRGSLQFVTKNGYAAYRRTADVAGGWRYVRTASELQGAGSPSVAPKATEPAPPAAAKRYRHQTTNAEVEAFQWLPHAIPAAPLPGWFIKADFEHNKDGVLTIRNRNGVAKAEPSDWVIKMGDKIVTMKAVAFQSFAPV